MRFRQLRISTRLLLAQAIVLIATIATAAVIAALVGPPLFHRHLREADHTPGASPLDHVERAFGTASVISLGVAMGAATVLALAISWYLSRRFQVPLTTLRQAAAEVAQGNYKTRVPVGEAGPELDALAESLNTLCAQLAATEETRRRLLSDLAHELRTPLATLQAYLEGLDDGVRHWDAATKGVLGDQVTRLARLAEDLGAISRAEEGRLDLVRELVPINDLITAATATVTTSYTSKGVDLRVTPAAAERVAVDRTRSLHVLTNLLDNARRHTPPRGTVTITTQVTSDRTGPHSGPNAGPNAGPHTGARGAEGKVLTIAITDTGDGIPKGQLGNVFERFYRGDSARSRDQQGSGIGLTISRAIVEAHGGQLTAFSEGPGHGATFAIEIPMAPTTTTHL
jgi:two-component system, OmpR family, sensor histidine kinase BaeS